MGGSDGQLRPAALERLERMNRRPRSTNEWKALIGVLSDILSGRVGITEGSRRVVDLRDTLNQESNDLFLPFVGVDSETDHVPLGDVRARWSSNALAREDLERARYEQESRPFVVEASEKLLQYAWRHAL